MRVQSVSTTDVRIERHAKQLSRQLKLLRERLFPPFSQKTLRTFTSGEAAQMVGVSDGYLRQLSLDGKGPTPEVSSNGRRSYTLGQINQLRKHMASIKPKDAITYFPRRRSGEKLQTIAVTNFKGGSAKTTTTLYLAQYLALAGYRVLAVDLDPQASLTSMLGVQPEFDVDDLGTLYGAIRYNEKRRPLKDIIRKTYFDGLDLVPGNLELMEFEHDTPRALNERSGTGEVFFKRVGAAIAEVEQAYDLVIMDCPPQLGYLTLGAVCAATALLITVHPQMVDVASMSQFLLMTSDLLSVVRKAGGDLQHDFIKYVVTRHEPFDGPQSQIVALLRGLFGADVLTATVLKSTSIADVGLTKQTLYEIEKGQVRKSTYDRALESINAANGEVLAEVHKTWGRR
ncbi:plasmid partitioning protein RepA [Sinorhizobium meliloti]|uniref:plasmid partitioning protein RepA n=1 Tax=Rhizobium meliloti TaxID=382 RepID=UPI00238035C5|nr:plasmid partitioning protein RepA [Sinorhizobium meliloti]MDE3759793.1 plasmid partitioning protein RepA [Sinorhizobium meliloti]